MNPSARAQSTRRGLVTAILAAAADAVAIAMFPGRTRLLLQIGVAVVGGIAILYTAAAVRRAAPVAAPSPLDRFPRPVARRPDRPPVGLVRIERHLATAAASRADARRQLGPLVAAIASERLRDRGEPTSVALPDCIARLLAPDDGTRESRDEPGLDADAAARVVDALEQL